MSALQGGPYVEGTPATDNDAGRDGVTTPATYEFPVEPGPPLDSWTGLPCKHDADDLGRYEPDVCHGCGADVGDMAAAEVCTLCDYRIAVVSARRLGDVALHVTVSRPLGDDARCLECVVDDLTRLVVPAARGRRAEA